MIIFIILMTFVLAYTFLLMTEYTNFCRFAARSARIYHNETEVSDVSFTSHAPIMPGFFTWVKNNHITYCKLIVSPIKQIFKGIKVPGV